MSTFNLCSAIHLNSCSVICILNIKLFLKHSYFLICFFLLDIDETDFLDYDEDELNAELNCQKQLAKEVDIELEQAEKQAKRI